MRKPQTGAGPFKPGTVEDLCSEVAIAFREGRALDPVALDRLRSIRDFQPEDMTVTVDGGMPLRELQQVLAGKGQWLPLDPPGWRDWTIEELISGNVSGSRRFGYGTLREHILGMEAVTGTGEVIHAGGKVVKNVAGFDLHRLWVGSRRRLGILTAATFKLRPLPAVSKVFTRRLESIASMMNELDRISSAPIEPAAVDCSAGPWIEDGSWDKPSISVIIEGDAEAVDWQAGKLDGYSHQEGDLIESQLAFWGNGVGIESAAVLPSRLGDWLQEHRPVRWLARAGNGVIYFPAAVGNRSTGIRQSSPIVSRLEERVVQALDPAGVWKNQPVPGVA